MGTGMNVHDIHIWPLTLARPIQTNIYIKYLMCFSVENRFDLNECLRHSFHEPELDTNRKGKYLA